MVIGTTRSSVLTFTVVPATVRFATSSTMSTLETSNGFFCCKTRTQPSRWLTCGETVWNRTRVMSFISGSVCRNRNCMSGAQSTHSFPHQ